MNDTKRVSLSIVQSELRDGRLARRSSPYSANRRWPKAALAGLKAAPSQTPSNPLGTSLNRIDSPRIGFGDERLDILLIEDSPSDAWLVDQQLRESGGETVHVTTVTNLAEALNATTFRRFDAALLDLNLPDSQGLTTFDEFHSAVPDLPLIVLSGVANADVALAVLRRGAQDCVLKSEVPGALLDRVIRLAIERLRMARELDRRLNELKQNETRILKIIEESRESAFIVIDEGGTVKFANEAALHMLNRRAGALVGKKLDWAVPKEGSIDVAIRRADQSDGIGELASLGETTVQAYGSIAGSLLTLRDVTDRRRAEEAVRSSEYRLRALLEHSIDSIVVVDSMGLVKYASPSIEKITGYTVEELYGIDGLGFLFADEMEKYSPLMDELKSIPLHSHAIQWQFRHKLGQPLFLEGTATNLLESPHVSGIVINFSDVTQRYQEEEARRQSQKLEALGTLAGGIAHDFNNILLAIAGNAKLALSDVGSEHVARRSLLEIDKASRRAADLVRRILSFSRRDTPQRSVVDLKSVIVEAAELLKSTLPAGIHLRLHLDSGAPPVLADTTQVHQVLLNLATNSLHAIADRTGFLNGSIEIRLDNVLLDAESASGVGDIPAGQYARLSVTDDGCGIDAALVARIFEPFFTTKPKGQGTGLGLSMAHGIVREHDGAITVRSERGKGSTFNLFLPAAVQTSGPPVIEQPESYQGQGERILYVDDEEALVFLADRVLKQHGYEADTFTDPEKALQTFRRDPARYSAVVTDLSMSGMSGFQLAQAIRAIRPTIPIILTSGHVSQTDRDRATQVGIDELILKPNTIDELGAVLHECLRKQIKNADSRS